MNEEILIKIAKILVGITIQKHRQKQLGKENMSTFIKNNLNRDISEEDYNKILHIYNKYLAKEGYEIKKDITKFDIIKYNTEEYQLYISK
jgi:hypothetical protein